MGFYLYEIGTLMVNSFFLLKDIDLNFHNQIIKHTELILDFHLVKQGCS